MHVLLMSLSHLDFYSQLFLFWARNGDVAPKSMGFSPVLLIGKCNSGAVDRPCMRHSTANLPGPGSAHKFFFRAIAGSQWRQAQILSPWLVGASGHGDLLREPLRPPYRRHFRSSVDLATHRSRAPRLNRCIVKGWTLDLIGTGY